MRVLGVFQNFYAVIFIMRICGYPHNFVSWFATFCKNSFNFTQFESLFTYNWIHFCNFFGDSKYKKHLRIIVYHPYHFLRILPTNAQLFCYITYIFLLFCVNYRFISGYNGINSCTDNFNIFVDLSFSLPDFDFWNGCNEHNDNFMHIWYIERITDFDFWNGCNEYNDNLIHTSGFATTHVVVSVRHPITY